MNHLNSHLHLAIQSIKCFTDDGKLDLSEINYLLGIALADNEIDQEENRVLGNIFRRALMSSNINDITISRIKEIKKKYNIE
jgi:hypothetical protein